MTESDVSAIPRWPTNPPTCAEMMTYCAGRAQRAYVLRERYIGTDPDLHMALIMEMIADHDRYLLLDALNARDPRRADELARAMWMAADAGDSYGEWIYDWCKAEGLDPEAIRAECEALS